MNGFIKFLLILVILSTLGNLVGQVILWAPPVSDNETAGGSGSGSENKPGNDNENNNSGTNVTVGSSNAPYLGDVYVSATVEPDENGQVPAGGVNLDSSLANATVPEGVQMEEGATELTLTVNGMEESAADLDLNENEVSTSLDVHMAGVSADNATPIEVKLFAAMAKGLNSTSVKLYHVENGETVEMTYIPSNEEFTAHNQFKYNPATGDVTLYVAGFSEFVLLADTENKWDGSRDYSWYDADAEQLYIANAQQLAGFSAIVGKMDGQTQDSFEDKTVTLIADIDLCDDEENNNSDVIFYPIGYWNNEGTYEKTSTDIDSGFYSFGGTFDGNGHTISNFYQNTWEMKGDHNWYDATLQYYRDGMGLFGNVYGGTVKNLTVENFSSDGEITTTGVIAAYAEGATFENIAIFNCNPRVYNIGNGGIVGCVGWYAKEADLVTTFTNITVDNTNKISALWGSYDVACGGILGQYYPTSGQSSAEYPKNGGIEFTNCHVSAVMDVYNDVCANYQYYAYRYTGMLIGSIRENETIDGRVYPKMDGIKAYGCTVHFGDWNDYYYCELVANTTASYTHDHQFSRLTQVASVDVENKQVTDLKGNTTAIPTSGRVNYVVVNGEHASENATCYHFVDGAVWNHEDAGYHNGENGEKFIDEDGDGVGDLKEDKQHIYLEFNNLFTGYGWGVTSVGLETYENVNVKDKLADIDIEGGNVEGSDTKFEYIYDGSLEIGKTYTLGELFAATNEGAAIKNNNVIVTISTASGKADYKYTMNTEDWKQSTLQINTLGDVTITITDYYFCKSTTITVEVTETEKFVSNITDDFLYRVGNQNAVTLDWLFAQKAGQPDVDDASVNVTVNTAADNYTFTKGNTWTAGTIKFNSFTGVVKITIQDATSKPCSVTVEVVDGKNTTSAESATSSNIVLHGNISNGFTVSGRYAFYGNGFTLNYTSNGQYLNNGLKQGLVTVSENGTLDNLRIVAPIYPKAYLYYGSTMLGDYVQGGPSTVDGDKTRYHYQLSAVALSGNGTISNCYIYGGRNNIFVNTGDVTIKDTILECGTVANVQIQSNASHTITLENVTTIQYQVNPTVWGTDTAEEDKAKVMLGAGILVGPETNDNPKIVLNGDFKQYNWVTSDDANSVSDTKITKAIIQGALDATEYNHTVNGNTASNLGIIYMNEYEAEITDNTGLPYKLGNVEITISNTTVNGQVYSLQNATSEQIYSDYANADKTTVNGLYEPQFSYSANLGGQYIANTEGCDEFLYREGDTIYVMFVSGDTKEVDLAALVNIAKYTGQDLGTVVTVKDSNGNDVTITDGKITLSKAETYTVTYTVTDTLFYDKNGNTVENSIDYPWNVTISVSLKDKATPDAYFDYDTTKQTMGYAKKSIIAGGQTQYLPFLAGLKIYDYIGQDAYLRFDGDNDFNKIAAAEITGYTSANHVLIKVTLTDGGVINIDTTARAASGGSTYTGKLQTSGSTLYYVNDGTTSATTTTWVISNYSFIGNNGVTIDSGAVTFSNCENGSVPTGSFSTTINYTVSYDANGGNCGQTTGYATSVSSAVTLPTPSRSGKVFTGWFTAASGGTRVGGAGDSYSPTAAITLYAQWADPYTVTYDANGGSCGTTSEKYTGTALVLPTPSNGDLNFDGWYTAATGGTRVGGAGDSYSPTAAITLYAQWSNNVTVNYNANGGSCKTSDTYDGTTAITLPTPTRTGYKFNGWYDALTGGNKIGGAGESYRPSANITLYAQWTGYTVTYNANSGSCSTASQTYAGTPLTLPTPTRPNYTFNGWYTAASGGEKIGDAGASYTPSADITLYAQWSKTCVTPDTLITLADGTQKEIQHLALGDMVLAWNFYTGKYEVMPVSLLQAHSTGIQNVLHLYFEDGTELKILGEHGVFDADLNTFVFIDEYDVENYIGHSFVKQDGDSFTTVKLVDYEVTTEYTTAYTILSMDHYNVLAEGMFTVTPAHVGDNFFNPFDIGEDMKYDEEAVKADIEKYGLYTYEDFDHVLTYEQFVALNLGHFKVSVGKGYVTYDGLIYLIETFINNEDFNVQ